MRWSYSSVVGEVGVVKDECGAGKPGECVEEGVGARGGRGWLLFGVLVVIGIGKNGRGWLCRCSCQWHCVDGEACLSVDGVNGRARHSDFAQSNPTKGRTRLFGTTQESLTTAL